MRVARQEVKPNWKTANRKTVPTMPLPRIAAIVCLLTPWLHQRKDPVYSAHVMI